jgi:hypothetical protein
MWDGKEQAQVVKEEQEGEGKEEVREESAGRRQESEKGPEYVKSQNKEPEKDSKSKG